MPRTSTAVRHAPEGERPSQEIRTAHRRLRTGEWWRELPAYEDIDEETFLSHRWQNRNSIKSVDDLEGAVGNIVGPEFISDVKDGIDRAPMSVRITPYLISLIDWESPVDDPIRRQFLPLGSTAEPDHPRLTLDSLGEQSDSPVPGLTRRYPDKALFVALDTCPVYCRFCTRSYSVGLDTSSVDKVDLRPNPKRWEEMFEYVASEPELEDIVISGGDVANLGPKWIREIGMRLLAIPHIRRIRYATKAVAIMPQKILTDGSWLDALTEVAEHGRKHGKQVALHTHFNSEHEITDHSERAVAMLFERGIPVRNQAVLQRGVNDTEGTMIGLVKRLSWINVQPYYVYMHDLVAGVEELRTTLATGIELEKAVRGVTAGFNTPTFVVDAPGGGGKRDIHSYEHYDRDSGLSVFTAPSVKPGEHFIYADPLSLLDPEYRDQWQNEVGRQRLARRARDAAFGAD
jgi:lysine 2,3-aminomutase